MQFSKQRWQNIAGFSFWRFGFDNFLGFRKMQQTS